MSANESSNHLQAGTLFLTELECHDGALVLNYLFLFIKDPRFERIIDVLPIKVELAGEKIKKYEK